MPKRLSQGTSLRLFADDSLLYRTIKKKEDSDILQRDLDSLQQWEVENSMEFHPQKCQQLRVGLKQKQIETQYNIHGIKLQTTISAKYLGVTLDNNMNWSEHINNTYKKSNNTLSFLRKRNATKHMSDQH